MTTINNEDPAVPSVHEARELPEPAAWAQPDHLQKARLAPFMCRVEPTQRHADFVPLYTADQMRAAVAAEREDSERERDYLLWRMREIIPLFEEVWDALCAISLVAAKAYRVDLSLGSRMDAAGTRTREEFDAMLCRAAENEQPK